jgi:hypothetical protein
MSCKQWENKHCLAFIFLSLGLSDTGAVKRAEVHFLVLKEIR